MKVKCVRDRAGWTSEVLEERIDGVVMDWDFVRKGETRFIPWEEVAWIGMMEVNQRTAELRS